MLVSVVVDPSAFNKDCFNDLYTIHVEDFLRGIWRNGVLIVDRGRELQDALYRRAKCLPIKGQGAQILLTELLKIKSIAVSTDSLSDASSGNPLDLIYDLKTDTKVDALILGDESFETLRFNQERNKGIVQLSKYRDSDFERKRQMYCDGLEPIDTLSEQEVKDIIIRLVRFSKRLRFYDAYIGTGNNTSGFRKGIEYILSIWKEHGFFSSQEGIGEVEIYTCAEHVPNDDINRVKRKINRELMEWLKRRFPRWWQIKLFVKDDPDSIFHARYLETDHAVVRVDKGFDLFKSRCNFYRNFFTLNMMESSHLEECQNLDPKRGF